MKNLLLFLFIFVFIACGKDSEEEEPLTVSKVEYRVSTSINGAMVKYMNSQGDEVNAIMNDSTFWEYSFNWEKDLDSVGFKLKDYLNWATYQIVIDTDTVINYTGPIPEGGYAGWYSIYYKF